MIDIDPATIADSILNGTLRMELEQKLESGFRVMHGEGDAIPPPSYFASRITTIIHAALPDPPTGEMAWELYHEVLSACETARALVLGEEIPQN